MPIIRLSTVETGTAMPVVEPTGRRLIPRLQLRCLVRLPNSPLPKDGIIDTGSPFTWFPEAIWSRFQPGIDFEELPFEPGYTPPRGQTAGWRFTFRMARLLRPLVLLELHAPVELERHGVIVQFADGNPPISLGSKQPPRVVLGLWGGVLEGTSLRMSADATTGHTRGDLEW